MNVALWNSAEPSHHGSGSQRLLRCHGYHAPRLRRGGTSSSLSARVCRENGKCSEHSTTQLGRLSETSRAKHFFEKCAFIPVVLSRSSKELYVHDSPPQPTQSRWRRPPKQRRNMHVCTF
uniref:Uncharacterized protein n=1 Tax=Toxoplasma gondii COUG TaxID=1074873 RepID=A0A2G8Y0H1_TOXGO|nr:hypothetical protein TGCOUG_393530 [Toxoplasma gondii COUG]